MIAPRITLVSVLGALTPENGNEAAGYWPPMGALTLAASVRSLATVSIVELDEIWLRTGHARPAFEAAATSAVCATRPDIVGFSSISGSYPLTVGLAQRVALALPAATIIFGGPQASVTDTATLDAFPFVDLILRGEADESFPDLITALSSDAPISGIAGLTFRNQGKIRRNPSGPVILDLDRLPLPPYDLLGRTEPFEALPLELGRGCPFSCTFCSTNDFFRRRFRLKSASHVLHEMNRLNEMWGVTRFDLVHDMFTVDRHRVVEFCDVLIAAGSRYHWACSARTDCVDEELIHLMKKAGCGDIFFGIETGSRRMQKVIDKGLDLEVARSVFRQTNSLAMHATASLIIGYPQETEQDLRDTVGFFADSMMWSWVDPQLNILTPLAATPITDEYREQLTLDEHWAEVSENGTLQAEADRQLIAAHPEIFPNFYSFPFYTDRSMLRRLRDFVFAGLARCGGLMRAAYLHTGDMFDVFRRWDELYPNATREWTLSPEFGIRLIEFFEQGYPESRTIGALSRFYRQALAATEKGGGGAPPAEPYLELPSDVRLLDCDCDINVLLEAVAQGSEPLQEALETPVTVAIRAIGGNRSDIRRFPALSVDLLRHAERKATLAEIRMDFELRGLSIAGLPARLVADGAIQILEQDRFVQRIFPDRASPPHKTAFSADMTRVSASTLPIA